MPFTLDRELDDAKQKRILHKPRAAWQDFRSAHLYTPNQFPQDLYVHMLSYFRLARMAYRRSLSTELPYFEALRDYVPYRLIEDQRYDLHAILAYRIIRHNQVEIILAFAGTKSIENVLLDLQLDLVQADWLPEDAAIPRGFKTAFDAIREQVVDQVGTLLDDLASRHLECSKFTLFGHSLGGVLASYSALALKRMSWIDASTPMTLIQVGTPKAGNVQFALHFADQFYLTDDYSPHRSWHLTFYDDVVFRGLSHEYYHAPGYMLVLHGRLWRDWMRHQMITYEHNYFYWIYSQLDEKERSKRPWVEYT